MSWGGFSQETTECPLQLRLARRAYGQRRGQLQMINIQSNDFLAAVHLQLFKVDG